MILVRPGSASRSEVHAWSAALSQFPQVRYRDGSDGWELGRKADQRFRRITVTLLLLWLIIGVIIPFLELSGLTRGGGDTLEQRFVSLVPDATPAQQVEEPAPAPEEKPQPEEAKPADAAGIKGTIHKPKGAPGATAAPGSTAAKPGDKTGDGFNKVWRVATP